MKSRLRALLLASCALAVAAPALAVDVTGERTTPVETATANNGAADDVTITTGSTVRLPSGTGVTVNSNNSVSNAGTISIRGADGAVGIRVLGGFSGTITSTGQIILDEDFTRQDSDGDGTPDGPFAAGTARTGILIEGPAAFTGDVRASGAMQIEGNDSRGVDLRTGLTGSYVQSGTISVDGDRGVGVGLNGPVSGDVRLGGTTNVRGENSSGAVIAGDVGGGVSVGGTVASTGFQFQTSNYFDPDDVPAGFEPAPFDGDDLKDNGPALAIGGSVADGVLINGAVGGGADDDDADGNDPVKDIKGDFDPNRTLGSVISSGSAPALVISPDFAAAAGGDLVVGLVVEEVRDTSDDDGDGDREEILTTFLESHGFINRGTITGGGLNIGFSSEAVVVRGSADGTRGVVIQGGVLNTGAISTTAFEADATAFTLGLGAQTPRLDTTGRIGAGINTETNHTVTVLLIESGAMLSALTNSGSLDAGARGDGAAVFAIRDLSGTLLSIENTGVILAGFNPDGDDDDGDGLINDLDERTGRAVAIDLSGHQAGQNASILHQPRTATADTNSDGVIDSNDVPAPQIVGDILLGAGDDTVQLLGGTVSGALEFGAGADALTIDDGAVFTGGLSDADGQLAIVVDNGAMNVSSAGDVQVTSLSLGDQSTSSYTVDLRGDTPASTRIIAANAITIGGDAQITPRFVGIGSASTTPVEILRAEGGLTLAGGQSITDNLAVVTPFLFEAGLSTAADGVAESVVVSVRRRSAAELGMSANQALAYESVVSALNTDDELVVAIVNLPDAETFFEAYDQLLPEFSLSSLQFAVGNIDGSIGAVGNRLDAVRGGRSRSGAAWAQEFGLFMDRESTVNDPGYRGSGFGMAAGVDRPFGPFYAVGVSLVGAASEIEQPSGFDAPLSISTAQLGAYAASSIGNLLFDAHAAAGMDFFESERQVVVGGVTRSALGDWSAQHAAATARLAYDFRRGWLFIRPAVSVDYLRLDEDAYQESGGGPGVNLALSERSSEITSSTALISFGARLGDETRTWWSPRVRVGYRHESAGEDNLTTAQFVSGGDPFILRADDLPDAGGLFGFTFAAGSRYSSFALDYDADVRSGFVRHGLRVAFRFIF